MIISGGVGTSDTSIVVEDPSNVLYMLQRPSARKSGCRRYSSGRVAGPVGEAERHRKVLEVSVTGPEGGLSLVSLLMRIRL